MMFTSKFMNWCCASRTAATKTLASSCRIALCHWLAEQHEEEVADWFSTWWYRPVNGCWLLGNGWHGLVANIQDSKA